MFRTLIYPSSGACNYSVELPHWSYCSVELPHWSYCSWFVVNWSFSVVGLEWYPCCKLKQPATRIPLQSNHSETPTHACNTDTTPNQTHQNSNTHRTKNNTTNVVIQQNSSKLLMTDILMSEVCWAHKKWNKITTDIKFVFYSSTIILFHMLSLIYVALNTPTSNCLTCRLLFLHLPQSGYICYQCKFPFIHEIAAVIALLNSMSQRVIDVYSDLLIQPGTNSVTSCCTTAVTTLIQLQSFSFLISMLCHGTFWGSELQC